jgi:hypothetical protein
MLRSAPSYTVAVSRGSSTEKHLRLQPQKYLLTGITPFRHTIEASVAFDYLSGGARPPGLVIRFSVDCPSPWWIKSFN